MLSTLKLVEKKILKTAPIQTIPAYVFGGEGAGLKGGGGLRNIILYILGGAVGERKTPLGFWFKQAVWGGLKTTPSRSDRTCQTGLAIKRRDVLVVLGKGQ